MDIVDQIADYWCGEILQGAASVRITRLREVTLPENLMQELTKRSEEVLHQELERIYANPHLDFKPRQGEEDYHDRLATLLSERMVLTAELVRGAAERVYRSLVEGWRVEPISLRQASEDPESFAAEIFRRAAIFAASGDDDGRYPAHVLAFVCEASGLKPLSEAVKVERELTPGDIDFDGFTLLTSRLMNLKQRYSIGRRLIAYEGTGKTIAEAIFTGVETAAEPAAMKPAASFEEAARAAPAAPRPPAEPVKAPSHSGLDASGDALYNALMTEDNLAYFSEVLFEKDTVSFQRLAYQIARQKKLSNALTLADNELFLREIPSHALPTTRLMRLIRENFRSQSSA